MKYILIVVVSIMSLASCKGRKIVLEKGEPYSLTTDFEDKESVVECFSDTTEYTDYYAVEYGTGRGNFTTRISVYRLKDDSVIVEGAFPVEQDVEHRLILFRGDEVERRLMLLDMTNHQLHEVKVPDEDEYRGFGAWVDYTIGDVTETEIEILFREGEMQFVVKR